MTEHGDWLLVEGRHPVEEALETGRSVREVILQDGIKEGTLRHFQRLAAKRGVPVRRVDKPAFRKIVRTAAPQGVIAWVEQVRCVTLDDVLSQTTHPGLVLLCDGVVDPHNLGALIRSALAAGASGVVIPKRRSAGLNQTVLKASAGAAWKLPIAEVTNLTRSIGRLKDAGYWVVGADAAGERRLWDVDFKSPTAVVIGGEGKGLSRLVSESCDVLAKVPMAGSMESLNASVAGALFLFEALRQRST